MPWCPICRSEYIEGFNTCSDCNCELVDILEPIIKEEIIYDKEALLITVNNGIEADLIESILNANNIPVLKKFKEAGAYLNLYMGMTSFGIDIYVPSKLFDEAKELIESRSEVEVKDDRNQLVNKRNIIEIFANRAKLIFIVAVLQILYSGSMLLMALAMIKNIKAFTDPIYLYIFTIHVILLILSIAVVLGKKYGWYGFTGYYFLLFMFNAILLLGRLFVDNLRESLIYYCPQFSFLFKNPIAFDFNINMLILIFEIVICGFIVFLFFEKDTIDSFNIRVTKGKLIIIVAAISIIASFIYLGFFFLIFPHYT